jgi:hypothetical protein
MSTTACFIQERHPALGKTIARLTNPAACAPKDSLSPILLRVRLRGPARNPSASGGLPFEPDTSPEFMNYLD